VEDKRLQKLEYLASHGNHNAAIEHAYGIKIQGHLKIHPILHKSTDRSRRNTNNVKHG
jgi:hypothetical protein